MLFRSSVEAAVVRDQLGEGVEIGRLELGHLAPLLDRGHDLVLVADRLQHAGVGGEAGLAAPLARQAELLEQDRRELLRGADRELLAGQLEDLVLELVDLLGDAGRGLSQPVGVELYALQLQKIGRASCRERVSDTV